MRQFDFIIALCAAEHVLSDTVALSNMLQGKHVDLMEAANESFVVINVLREQRNDELVWEGTFERAKAMAAEWNIERTMPRLATNQRHLVNVTNKRRDKAQLMRDTSDNKKKLIRELNTLRCHSL